MALYEVLVRVSIMVRVRVQVALRVVVCWYCYGNRSLPTLFITELGVCGAWNKRYFRVEISGG